MNILSPKGKGPLRTFDETSEGKGLADGISASADPYTGCDALNFGARPDLIQAEIGQVLHAFLKDRSAFRFSVVR